MMTRQDSPVAGTSPAVQDYLKNLFLIERESEAGDHARIVTTTQVAERLGVSAASATNMLKKLDGMGLVSHGPYKGAELTEPGRKIALEVIRHHRLIETYLAEALGVPWDEVHAEAEVLEHVISEALEERIADRLGHPTEDPHGHPIPPRDLGLADASSAGTMLPLTELEPGRRGTIAEVSDRDPELLRYLGGRGFFPGTSVTAVSSEPFGGSITVEISGEQHAIGRDAARRILVTELSP
jgi:DtxR family transcriptional regulator, Mn-dependent transcriptional regulator